MNDFGHTVLPYVNLCLILLTLFLVVRHMRQHNNDHQDHTDV
jgi:uncharacterized membrane protein